jgi:hypothetical protein
MTSEELKELRKSIKREIMAEISMNNKHLREQFEDKFHYYEAHLQQIGSRVTEIHKGLNIITDKLVDVVVKNGGLKCHAPPLPIRKR